MNFLKVLNSTMFFAAVLATFGAKANAEVIPVVDPYFDEFPAGQTAATYLNYKSCGTGCAFADAPTVGWTQSVNTYTRGANEGQWQIGPVPRTNTFNSDPMIDASTSEPIVLRSINATASQIVSTTAVAGVTYTLDVDLGFSITQYDYASVILIVGNQQVTATPLDDLSQKSMQLTGNWYDFEASYTATAADKGASIEILLSTLANSNSGWGYFGDVRLTDSLTGPVLDPPGTPEPATWGMMLIGFGGIAGIAALHRRRSAAGQLA